MRHRICFGTHPGHLGEACERLRQYHSSGHHHTFVQGVLYVVDILFNQRIQSISHRHRMLPTTQLEKEKERKMQWSRVKSELVIIQLLEVCPPRIPDTSNVDGVTA